MNIKYRYSFLISCHSKEPIEIKQTISNEMVTILSSIKKPSIKDSVVLSIPNEFRIMINSSDVGYIAWRYHVDGNVLPDDVFDYQVYNKQNKSKVIHNLNFDEIPKEKFIDIIIKERNYLISKRQAERILEKYKINKSLEDLKFGDTIKLIPYQRFRIENKEIINSLKKNDDYIDFKAMRGKEENFYTSKKINW
ncbi:hypothetical protein [Flavobacterium psychroterrae]|nr:hypothetical protein [Flavobacterium psychroterrae]